MVKAPQTAGNLWVESNGGPLLLLAEELVGDWLGTDRPSRGFIRSLLPSRESATPSDYERACQVNDYVGNIEVGKGWGVVLGDEPLSTIWRPCPNADGGVLVRWRYAEAESEQGTWLNNIPQLEFEQTAVKLVVAHGRVALFDSAYPGNDFGSARAGTWLEIPSGTYHLGVREWQPNPDTAFLLHHLTSG